MSKYYEKSVGNGEKLLYDDKGKCIGRGVTDKNGKTIYSGAGGYIGKSYETGHGTVKHFDSDNNYVGGGVKRSSVTTIHSNEDDKPIDDHTTSDYSDSTDSKPAGNGCFLVICWAIIIAAVFSILKILAS